MNTKFLLAISAGLMAAGGLILQFAPHEVLASVKSLVQKLSEKLPNTTANR